MGTVYEEITLKNVEDLMMAGRGYIKESEVRETTVRAVVDTGAWTLCINDAVRQQLGLKIEERCEEVTLANNQVEICSITEPVRVCWKDRSMVCEPLVFTGEGVVLLGSIPLEGMDLIVDPRNEKVVGRHGDKALFRA